MDWTARVRAALGEATPDDDVVVELAQHVAAAYEAARAEGDSPEQALRRADAQLAFERDATHRLRRPARRLAPVDPPRSGSGGLSGLREELRHAARRLVRDRWHSALVVATLAIGIGGTTALFSVVNGVLLKPLDWPNAERLVRLAERREGATRSWPWRITNATYVALGERMQTIDALAAWSTGPATWSGDGSSERVNVAWVTASLFPMLEANPQLGTAFRAADETDGHVLVLSHGLWQRKFGGRADVIGRLVQLDGEAHRVVGVMPAGFAFPDSEAGAWLPFRVTPAVRADGTPAGLSLFSAMARLRSGRTPQQASEEATVRARTAPDPGLVTMALFGARGPVHVSAVPAQDAVTAEVRPALLVLLAAIGLLLATATANVASLQLVRATARRRELAVRSALGAAAGRLARLLLAEAVILGVSGGALGLLLAVVAERSLPALLPAGFPRLDAVAIDARVAGFCAALALASGLGAGLLPALFVRRLRVGAALAEDGPTSVGAGRGGAARVRNGILAGQVAVATVLLLGALQLGRSFFAMLHAERGYDAERLLVVRLPMPEPAYTAERREQLVSDLLARLRNLPGVAEAAGADILPMSGYWAVRAFTMTSPAGVVRQVNASVNHVSPGYFRALGRRVHEGRPLLDTDTASSLPVVVVNRSFARHYLDGRALGAQLPADDRRDGWTVVGVVDDLVQKSVKDEPQPEILTAWSQNGGGLRFPEPSLVIRAAGDPAALAANVRGVLQQLDPTLAPSALVPMQQLVNGSLAQPRLYAVLLASFAACAAVVMGVGLLGSLSYGVALRTREIGLRLALGARPADVVRMIAAQAFRIVAAGLAVGLAASLALGRTIAVLLYGVSEHDPLSFSTVPLLVLVLAAGASVGPALRAARTDPLRALRNE